MIDFKPISLADREVITSFTLAGDSRDCDFSFANLCSWHFLYDSEYAVVGDMLLIRCRWGEHRPVYMPPLGTGDMAAAVRLLERQARTSGHELCLVGVSPELVTDLERLFPGRFVFTPERDYFDYIYERTDLITLSGKKYQAKRNHINRFRQEYPDCRYKPLTSDMIPQCLALDMQWCISTGRSEDSDLLNERHSMTFALEHMDELGIRGGVLCIGDDIEAFTFGSPVTADTFGVHVEKANTRIEGIYAVVNREFVRHIPENYRYINREEDLGIPGLRKAKLSYHPTILLEKNMAVWKG
ncbi:MAG: DUF2156 domain-containing protein [Coprobacter sp.]|nr:DUF2156 domain-containing protein [Coprobacter sp.]